MFTQAACGAENILITEVTQLTEVTQAGLLEKAAVKHFRILAIRIQVFGKDFEVLGS